jgi:hypothetical protein
LVDTRLLQQRVVEYMVKRVLLGCRGLPWYRYGAEVEGRPDPRGLPGHRSYAVGRFWVTKIKANIEPGQKTKFRILKHLRSDEAKAAEELKTMKLSKRTSNGKRYASRMPLTRALPAGDVGLDEDPDPADCFS